MLESLFWLMVATSCVVLLAMVFDSLCQARFGWQDAVWRFALLVIAILPLAVVLRAASPKWELPIGSVEPAFSTDASTAATALSEALGGEDLSADDSSDALTAPSVPAPSESLSEDVIVVRIGVTEIPANGNKATSSPVNNSNLSVSTLLLGIWFAGTLFSLSRLARAWFHMCRLKNGAIRVRSAGLLRLARKVEVESGLKNESLSLLQSAEIDSPITVGFLRPVIFFPSDVIQKWEAAEDLDAAEEVILHEAAHIARYDAAWNLLMQVVLAVWWFHPLVHYMNRRICWLREILCDGSVIGRHDPIQYAETLLRLAVDDGKRESTGRAIAAIGLGSPRSMLESRIQWILSAPSSDRLRSFHRRVVSCVCLATACTILGGVVLDVVPRQSLAADETIPGAAQDTKKPDKIGVGTAAEEASVNPTGVMEVRGKVVLPSGEPAKSATVYLLADPEGYYFTLPTRPLTTKTDQDGTYRFADAKVTKYRIWAETENFTSLDKKLGGLRFDVGSTNGDVVDVDPLKLHDGCGYDVKFIDKKTQRPISGAKISFGWTDIAREYRSNELGVAQIRNLSRGEWYFVVKADGYGTVFKKTSKQKHGSVLSLQFEMEPGGRLEGILLDDNGEPVADARIVVGSDEVMMSPGYGAFPTGTDGSFVATGLPRKTMLNLYVDKDGYEHGRRKFSLSSTSDELTINVARKPAPGKVEYGGDISVTVLDGKRKPIPGATVSNYGRRSSEKRSAITDTDGKCLLQNIYAGLIGPYITIKAPGFQAQKVAIEPGTIESPGEVEIQLLVGKKLRGRVLKPDGSGASGAWVNYNGGLRVGGTGGRVTTNSEGRFEIDGLADTATIGVSYAAEFAPVPDRRVDVDNEEITFNLKLTGLIRIRAVDSNSGKPVPEYNVKLGFCEQSKPGDPKLGGLNSELMNPGVNIMGTTPEYRLDRQTIGMPHKVIVSAEGYEPRTLPRVVAVRSDKAKRIDVQLQRIDPDDYQRIAGKLVDSEGAPIANANVRLLVGKAIPVPTVTNAGFRLNLFGPPPAPNYEMRGWKFYHWDLLEGDDIENRDQCLQVLKTVSDKNGRFDFPRVKREGPWVEIFYFGDDVMSQRYSNVRERQDLEKLVLKATKPGSLLVKFDGSEYPSGLIGLSAENYVNGPNAVDMAFGSKYVEFKDGQDSVEIPNLPHGAYHVSLSARPMHAGHDRNHFVNAKHQSQTVVIPNDGQQVVVEF